MNNAQTGSASLPSEEFLRTQNVHTLRMLYRRKESWFNANRKLPEAIEFKDMLELLIMEAEELQ